MPGVGIYVIEVRYRWWFVPLLKILLKFGITKKGSFNGIKSAGVGITGNPSAEISFNN